MVQTWLKEAAAVRQALEDARVRLLAEPAEETRRHLQRLLDFATMQYRVAGLAAPIAALSKGRAAALAAQHGARQRTQAHRGGTQALVGPV